MYLEFICEKRNTSTFFTSLLPEVWTLHDCQIILGCNDYNEQKRLKRLGGNPIKEVLS